MEESNECPFPNLTSSNHCVTSPTDENYNCVAWAAGKGPEDGQWWWPIPAEPGYIWPENVPREETIECFVKAFESMNYSICESGCLETEYEKVVIYAMGNEPRHVARQLRDGRWTSKLGQNVDICHTSPEVLEGPVYGSVSTFMRRRVIEEN